MFALVLVVVNLILDEEAIELILLCSTSRRQQDLLIAVTQVTDLTNPMKPAKTENMARMVNPFLQKHSKAPAYLNRYLEMYSCVSWRGRSLSCADHERP